MNLSAGFCNKGGTLSQEGEGMECSLSKIKQQYGFYVYILECRDGSFYTGWTSDPVRRVAQHNRGRGSRYTRSRLPVRLVYLRSCLSQSDAMRQEARMKRLSRQEKKTVIAKNSVEILCSDPMSGGLVCE